MISTLADLVSPLSEGEFAALLRARTPLLQRGAGGARYAALIDWDGFMQIALGGAFPPRNLRITQCGMPLAPGHADMAPADLLERHRTAP